MIHEDLERAYGDERTSERSFGLFFAACFFILGCWPLASGNPVLRWAIVLGVAAATVAMLAPRLLAPLNVAWAGLGVILGRIVSPIALAILYFGVMTPIGWIGRATGKDPLRVRREADAQSYWIERLPPGPPPDSLPRQY